MPVLTASQVMSYAKAAGFPDSVLVDAAAYAGIESSWNTTAVSPTGCVGLWQICGQPVPGDLNDPSVNAANAYYKWSHCNGGSFACDWTPYDGGPANPYWSYYYNLASQAAGSTGSSGLLGAITSAVSGTTSGAAAATAGAGSATTGQTPAGSSGGAGQTNDGTATYNTISAIVAAGPSVFDQSTPAGQAVLTNIVNPGGEPALIPNPSGSGYIPNPKSPYNEGFGGLLPPGAITNLIPGLKGVDAIAGILAWLVKPVNLLRVVEVAAGGFLLAVGGALYLDILIPGIGGVVGSIASVAQPEVGAVRAVARAPAARRQRQVSRAADEQTERTRATERRARETRAAASQMRAESSFVRALQAGGPRRRSSGMSSGSSGSRSSGRSEYTYNPEELF